jgi:Carboxypeptidase regulatory-like domain
MKKNIFWGIIVVLAVALVLWRWNTHRANQSPVAQPAAGTSQSSSVPASPPQLPPKNMQTASASALPNPATNQAAWMDARIKQMEQDHQNALNDWRTPIEFYGEVVDENTNPVASAKIDFSCNDLSPTGTSNYQTVSDANGFFSITGITGKLLNVNVSKEGYYTSKRDNNYYTYAGNNINFMPDSQNPVIFHLRKKMKGESLITIDYPGFAHIAQLHHDGTPVEIDLFKGVQVPLGSGQLRMALWRDSSDKNARVYDWSLQLTAPNGGLVETDEEFDFEAPQAGYQPSIMIDMPATNINWKAEVRSKYYIQLANGDYGRIDFYILSRNGVFTVSSAINPNGSQDLEPAQ